MSLLQLWSVLICSAVVRVVRNDSHEILYSGNAGEVPAKLFPMRVCYVDIMDRFDILFISVEELDISTYINNGELEGKNNAED